MEEFINNHRAVINYHEEVRPGYHLQMRQIKHNDLVLFVVKEEELGFFEDDSRELLSYDCRYAILVAYTPVVAELNYILKEYGAANWKIPGILNDIYLHYTDIIRTRLDAKYHKTSVNVSHNMVREEARGIIQLAFPEVPSIQHWSVDEDRNYIISTQPSAYFSE